MLALECKDCPYPGNHGTGLAEQLSSYSGLDFQKHDLPRALLDDNGAAMVAIETEQGPERLGILLTPGRSKKFVSEPGAISR